MPYYVLRPIYWLQMMSNNYKPTSMLMAAGGAGLLIFKLFSGMFF